MNLPRTCGRTRTGTPGGLWWGMTGAIVCTVRATGADELDGVAIDTPRSYDVTRFCFGAILTNHAIVRRSPPRSGTAGDHPNTAWAFPMSGRRRAGSSWGRGRWTILGAAPTSEGTITAQSQIIFTS